MKLLLIHGRSQQGEDPETLKQQWLGALQRGFTAVGVSMPDGVDVAFPYYGDKLDEFARQADVPLTEDVRAKGGEIDPDYLTFQAELLEEMRKGIGVTEAMIYDEFGDDPREKGPQNWKWVHAILRAIDRRAPGITSSVLDEFMRDVYLYTKSAGVRNEINRIVAGKLTEEPTVVVGHSLGTVVSYSVLREDTRNLNVPLHVTVGSPLGIRPIRNQFRPLRFPAAADWYNAFDKRDVVALYPLDANNFPVDPAVENNATVDNHTDNRHGIVGYLDDVNVARRIHVALSER